MGKIAHYSTTEKREIVSSFRAARARLQVHQTVPQKMAANLCAAILRRPSAFATIRPRTAAVVRCKRTWTKSERVYAKIEKHAEEKRLKDRAKRQGTANLGGAVERRPEFDVAAGRCTTVEHRRPLDASKVAAGGVFAVVEMGGTQFKVAEGDVVICNKLPGQPVGKEFDVEDVLLVGGVNATVIGQPRVPEARVTAVMEQQTLEKKVTVFKMKRRQGYRRKNGHRREISVLRIKEVHPGPVFSKANA